MMAEDERDHPTPGPRPRVLCLGNDLVADDAFGLEVARELRRRRLAGVEVRATMESGFALLDHLLEADPVIVVDTVQTGSAPPGTIHVVRMEEMRRTPGGSPHYVGLFESVELGAALGLPVPKTLVIVAVEAADLRTIGGPMSAAVAAQVAPAAELVRELLHSPGERSQRSMSSAAARA